VPSLCVSVSFGLQIDTLEKPGIGQGFEKVPSEEERQRWLFC